MLFSHRKEGTNAICNNMDVPTHKWSESKTDTVWYHLNAESKTWHKWTYLWNRNRIMDIENRFVLAKRKGMWGEEWIRNLRLEDESYYI